MLTVFFLFLCAVFSVFQIVQFNNSMCNATDGTMGVCFTAAECSLKAGTADHLSAISLY
jgi:hypothetical protein